MMKTLIKYEFLKVLRKKSTLIAMAVSLLNRPLSSRQVKKEKLRHKGLVPVSKGSQAL